MKINAEYIWLDGTKPTQLIRSKTRVINVTGDAVSLSDIPFWGFDGSSTNQAQGDNSDCILRPVSYRPDPIRGGHHILVMCEVDSHEATPHITNSRAVLRTALAQGGDAQDLLLGFEQEYTLLKNSVPLGWPHNGFPAPQGPYYCGVGSRVFGRDLVEDHLQACHDADLLIYGINAEVMPGQWEFQIGYRGFADDTPDALRVTDDMWYATWLLNRLAEDYDITVSYDNKPVQGDWNGAGCHTNFSTKAMRDPKTGSDTITSSLAALKQAHAFHIKHYGAGLSDRLTGKHETCSIHDFKYGNADRGASIRVPIDTAKRGYGYLEDRRPGANSDPYIVASCLVVTLCNLDQAMIHPVFTTQL